MKSIYISNLKKGDSVNDTFAVFSKGSIKPYKNKPGTWFSFTASDKTGQINAKFWGTDDYSTEQKFNSFSPGDIVTITGTITEYNGESEINIDQIIKVSDDSYDLSDFLKTTSKDIPQMITKLQNIISSIQNPHIKILLESFTSDDDFMKKYSQAPAGRMWHHDFVGGLLEHVHSLIAISNTVHQSHPQLDLDLLVAACILHDIGKTVEFKMGPSIEITDEGRLHSHIAIGYLMVAQKIQNISDFPEILRNKILHIILSHHGKPEYGSPIKPMFAEAVAFSQIDDTDAKTQHIKQVISDTDSEDSFIWPRLNDNTPVYLK